MYQVYKVESSDTLDSIAKKIGTTVEMLKQINGNDKIYPGSYIIVPSAMNDSVMEQNNADYIVYIVQKGDNVYEIAREYGVPYETLLRINGLNENDYIYPNQQLLIPRGNIYVTKETDTIMSLYNANKNNWESFLMQNQDIYVVPDQMITSR